MTQSDEAWATELRALHTEESLLPYRQLLQDYGTLLDAVLSIVRKRKLLVDDGVSQEVLRIAWELLKESSIRSRWADKQAYLARKVKR